MRFSVAQALTASGASTNVIDFKQGHRAPGKGQPLFLVVQLKADADGANGNETYAVTLQTDSAENFSGVVDVVEVPIPRGTKAGKRYVVSVPHNTDRFLRGQLHARRDHARPDG